MLNSAKAFSSQPNNQYHMKPEHMNAIHQTSDFQQHFDLNHGQYQERQFLSDPLLCDQPASYYQPIQGSYFENSLGNCHSNLMQQQTGSETDFPLYQLENGHSFQENALDFENFNLDSILLPANTNEGTTDANCHMPASIGFTDQTFYQTEQDNIIVSTNCTMPKRYNNFQSMPIDIQPNDNGMTQGISVLVPPASDRNGSICQGQSLPDCGSSSSATGEILPSYSNQNQTFVNFHQPTNQLPYNIPPGNAPFSIQVSEDIHSPSQNGFCTQRLSSADQFAPNEMTCSGNETYDDVFVNASSQMDHITNSQSCPNFHFERYPSADFQVSENQINYPNQNYNNNIPSYPPQTHSNATVVSNEGSDWGPSPRGEEYVDSPSTNSFSISKSDDRRIRNNIACKKARERRKRKKEDNEARVRSLQEENTQLKQTIFALENQVANFRSELKKLP